MKNLTSPTNSRYFCPVCGGEMAVEQHNTSWKGRTWAYPLITCETMDCPAYRATITPDSVLDGSFLAGWHLTAHFDLCTGESLLLREIEDLRCACNLLLIVADDTQLTRAFADDTAVHDPHALVQVLRDWTQVLTGQVAA
jgi:hypothetical protein